MEPATHEGLQRRIAELSEALAARDAFMAASAHELRNPMTPILGQVELLMAGVKAGRFAPDQVEERLGRVQHSVNRYLNRAAVLFAVSKLTRGEFRPLPEPFDLTALMREIAAEFEPVARHAGVPITLAVPATLPVGLDRQATNHIIDNLVSNALKHGDRTPVEVSAAIFGEQVRITVRDGGPGVPPGDRTRLLETFERVIRQTGRRSGFGVGLWIVGQFVAAMEGTAAIGDAAGGGALCTVTLPLHLRKAYR